MASSFPMRYKDRKLVDGTRTTAIYRDRLGVVSVQFLMGHQVNEAICLTDGTRLIRLEAWSNNWPSADMGVLNSRQSHNRLNLANGDAHGKLSELNIWWDQLHGRNILLIRIVARMLEQVKSTSKILAHDRPYRNQGVIIRKVQKADDIILNSECILTPSTSARNGNFTWRWSEKKPAGHQRSNWFTKGSAVNLDSLKLEIHRERLHQRYEGN